MTNGIILSPYHHKKLSKEKATKKDSCLHDVFINLLIYDKLIVFDHLIDQNNYKVIQKLKANGLIEEVPQELVNRSFANMATTISSFYSIHSSFDQYLQLENETSLDAANDDIYDKAVRNEKYDLLLDIDKHQFHIDLFIDKNRPLKNFISNFGVKRSSKANTEAFSNFMYMDLPPILLYELDTYFDRAIAFDDAIESLKNLSTTLLSDYNQLSIRLDNYGHSLDIDLKSFEQVVNLIEAKIHLEASLKCSSDLGVPIKLPPSNKSYTPIVKQEKPLLHKITEENEHFSQLYSIILEEIRFPEISTLDQALKLRENKNIKTFRSQMHEWNRALQLNEMRAVKDLKEYLIKANHDIFTIENLKRYQLEWYIEIPLAILEELITGTHFGLLFSLYSGLIKTKEAFIKRKYRWLMLN